MYVIMVIIMIFGCIIVMQEFPLSHSPIKTMASIKAIPVTETLVL